MIYVVRVGVRCADFGNAKIKLRCDDDSIGGSQVERSECCDVVCATCF